MTVYETDPSDKSGIRKFFERLFRERELIFRSEGRVSYIRLRPAPQVALAVGGLAVSLWLAGANGLAWWQEQRIQAKQSEILEASIAYEQLRAELSIYQERLAALATDILAHRGDDVALGGAVNLEELAAVTAGIEGAFEHISRDLNVTEADRQRIIQSRDALHDRISALESELAAAMGDIDGLTAAVDDRDAQLTSERAVIAALTDSRDDWRGRAEELNDDLGTAREKIDGLESELESTVAALTQERSRVETLADIRERLARQVASLQTGLNEAETRGVRLSENLTALTANLEAVERDRIAVAGERAELSSDLTVVEAELSLHQAATERTRERLERVVFQLADLTHGTAELTDEETSALKALEEQIADITGELRYARNNASSMETAIGEVVVGLARVAGDSPTRLDALTAPSEKVDLTRELLTAVARVQEDQQVLIARLSEQTASEIARSERLLTMAGLDIDTMLRASGFEPGVGGPLEEIAPEAGGVSPALPSEVDAVSDAGILADEIAVLEARLVRMAALNDLMGCVPLISPVDNFQLTSPFGQRKDPITGQYAMHKGIDIGGWAGIKVHVTAPGIVTFVGRNGGYGKMVEVDHGCGIKTLYAHLKRTKVTVGEVLDHRTIVGTLGSTGRSTGPHVHYEIKIDGKHVDPEKLIEAGRHVHKT